MKTVYKWFVRFCDGCESVEDEERSGCPSTSKTEEDVERINEMIRLNIHRIFCHTSYIYIYIHTHTHTHIFIYVHTQYVRCV